MRVGVGGARYDGVASFGRRPMFDNGAVLLEVFLFDFSGDLYGAALDVAFIGWIRPEMKFDSVEDLIRRMDQDSSQARGTCWRGRPDRRSRRSGSLARPCRCLCTAGTNGRPATQPRHERKPGD